jgi:hypothetical protein
MTHDTGMDSPLARLQRIGAKLFLRDGASVRPKDFVAVFHRWIRTRALDGLLIDVADYEHVSEGPSIVLVGHEGNYSLDTADGRMGLCYSRKQPARGDLDERLVTLVRSVVRASRLLEEDADLGGGLHFEGGEILLFANDRLLAPNSEATFAAFRPALDGLLRRLYGDGGCEITRNPEPRERFTLTIKAPRPVALGALSERLGK